MTKRVVLAYGEVTGHAHAFYDADVEYDTISKKLNIKENATLSHEEHTKQDFTEGEGIAYTQREYRLGKLRRVSD